MKLATFRNGTRDGALVVVSRDLTKAVAETILDGKPRTPFRQFGDRVRIEMLDEAGRSIFGAIDQQVVRYDK